MLLAFPFSAPVGRAGLKLPRFGRAAVAAATLLLSSTAIAQTADSLAPTGRWSPAATTAARTPPMGWSSWNAFRTEITEDKVIGAAEALVKTGLADAGYRYVNVDDGWWLKRRQSDGRLQIRTAIFPSAATGGPNETSFRPFTDRIHALGLKAGIYTDVGNNACSQAYDLHSPNLPVGTTAEREVGLNGHVDQDIRLLFADWNFDYVKVDACGLADYAPGKPIIAEQNYRAVEPLIVRGSPARTDDDAVRALYSEVAAAMRRTDPAGENVLSICAWGQANVRAWGKDVGNLWRTGEDIVPTWASMLQSFDAAAGRPLYAQPGAWNDPDMLFIGAGDFDDKHLTEARSHFSLWSIINAPLLIGYDLRSAPKALLDIWGNRDVVAVNQDAGGHQGVIAYNAADLQIVVKTLSDGNKAVVLLNRSGQPLKATLTAGHLKMADDGAVALRDLWSKKTSSFTGQTELTLQPRETRMFVASGRRQLADGYYLSELPGIVNVAVDGVRQSELDPTIARGVSPWSGSISDGERPMYAGWGGATADVAPYGTTLTVAGQSFTSGIGILSDSRMEVRSGGGFARFSASVGVDDSTRNRAATVRFSVYGDGKLLTQTGPVRFGGAPVPLTADLRGARTVELVVRSSDPKGTPVTVAWGQAALTGSGR